MPNVSVLSDIACELGEGPTYDPHTDTLWWFDIVGRKLFSWQFAEGRLEVQELPFMASVLARIDDRRQLIVAEDGIYVWGPEIPEDFLHNYDADQYEGK